MMVIEQTLHGYDMGHGLLASSLPNLAPEDQALLFKLSDWTGFHVLNANEEDCYLTAYPLPSKKYYAIAKTWYADEMERSGCVWTHTLLIPIDGISQEFDFRTIIDLFHYYFFISTLYNILFFCIFFFMINLIFDISVFIILFKDSERI